MDKLCFAVIPWSEIFNEDRLFDVNSNVNRDYLLEPYKDMKLEFEKQGHIIHTIDCYNNYRDIDYFLFFRLDWEYYRRIIGEGRDDRMVLCSAEPPSVNGYNNRDGYRVLKHIFPYIMSWNDDWVDNNSVFKRNIPYFFIDQTNDNVPYNDKKLITLIAGNKESDYPGELYSERRRAIDYFENNHPDKFEFYGNGWDSLKHPCYKGRCKEKAEVFHRYRFAICYENMQGLNGYITEKLLDCLESGIVPIYLGAPNIKDIVPGKCFIDFRDFANYDELFEYIVNIDEKKYLSFLSSAKDYISSEHSDYFSGRQYAKYIIDAVNRNKMFKSSYLAYKFFKLKYL